ncbi:MAG: MarR family winged helix-turn-helix transcriptional regulator [Actinomycetota bacterium]|nr:MarR family winged helix-turn-helix transcriptional regulator [Actinomycetota bacterium]
MTSIADRFTYAFERVYWLLGREWEHSELTEHEQMLLWHIPLGEGRSLTWLASHLGLPQSTASVRVKDLEKRGFLTRVRDPRDERRLRIDLTAKARHHLASWTPLDTEALEAALSSLASEDRDHLSDLMQKLAEAALALQQGPDRQWRAEYVARLVQWRAEEPSRSHPAQGDSEQGRVQGTASPATQPETDVIAK